MTVAAHEELSDRAPEDSAANLFGVLGEDGSVVAGASIGIDDALLLRMYREMKRVRLLDQRMVTLQRQGRVGFYGACTGQEAAVVGTGLAAAAEDWIFPALRERDHVGPRLARLVHRAGVRDARDPLKGRGCWRTSAPGA
jgi:TPP-dependent pyruvate/acetoin dehydrogenase alpha subunit